MLKYPRQEPSLNRRLSILPIVPLPMRVILTPGKAANIVKPPARAHPIDLLLLKSPRMLLTIAMHTIVNRMIPVIFMILYYHSSTPDMECCNTSCKPHAKVCKCINPLDWNGVWKKGVHSISGLMCV
jgi:hypothetical protein